jgi:glycosyltransferase involved in cell wall biosynthesis
VSKPRIAILHYTAPPVVGGVEAVIGAHTRALVEAGYPVTVMAGRGAPEALAPGAGFIPIPELDSQQPDFAAAAVALAAGRVPAGFSDLAGRVEQALNPYLALFDRVMVHNVLTKHFNLPLTAALSGLLDSGRLRGCLGWCHDATWTSPNSRHAVHAGYPWDLLRTKWAGITYVAVSKARRDELARLFGCGEQEIHVVYNGVDASELLGLSSEGVWLGERLGLLERDLVLLMPVRVTQAKNIEFALRVIAALKHLGCRPLLVLSGPPDPHDEVSMEYFENLRAMRRELGVDTEMRFVFESGPEEGEPFLIDNRVVGDLYRMSDVLFMPSHREGFGMPVLEAGLVGLPVVCTAIPAAAEIGGGEVLLLDTSDAPELVAAKIMSRMESSPSYRLRRRVRQRYTWRAIFERDIVPLLSG